jgi:hypothetical protein
LKPTEVWNPNTTSSTTIESNTAQTSSSPSSSRTSEVNTQSKGRESIVLMKTLIPTKVCVQGEREREEERMNVKR